MPIISWFALFFGLPFKKSAIKCRLYRGSGSFLSGFKKHLKNTHKTKIFAD